ncbi:MAG: SPOR domain-containing protein [Maricaulis sp.]|nr:SPOR domain-containing protein [Maricaulis sp.]
MKINLSQIALSVSAGLLAGCSSTTSPDVSFPEPVVAETRTAQLADATARELAHLARFEPALLEEVGPELRALAMALVVNANMPATEDTSRSDTAVLPPPPTDMAEATSLRHGIHLASYRLLENAQSGWAELQVRHGTVLGDMHARLETTHLDGRGTYLRLKAGPYDNARDAAQACRAIQESDEYCMPVDFSGQPLAE